MKAETLRNALHAHGWLGLLISVPLFIIFWAGAITLFHPEMQRWATMPHYPLAQSSQLTPLTPIVERLIDQYNIDPKERISVRLPSDHMPYLSIFFRVPKEENSEKKRFVSLTFNPQTGEQLHDHNPFELADFIYQLHYNLKLPQGLYIVGLITLFFMVLVFTGIVIRLKNLIKHFFMYRKDRNTRNKMNDLHNVVGVISLPYGLMYALTGLMFNLLILLQVPSALVLYQGDIPALSKDAGFINFNEELTGNPLAMPDLNALLSKQRVATGVNITGLNLHNYGDESAVFRLAGKRKDGFAGNYTAHYAVKTDSFPEAINVQGDNVFVEGSSILFSLHFANFAGLDLRFLYFVLAIGVCGMIVAGNVLWIVKRQKRATHPKTLAVMRGLTLGGCVGIMPATAIAILLERILPAGVSDRPEVVQLVFAGILLLGVIAGFIYQHHRRFVGWGLVISAVALTVTFAADWLMFGQTLLNLHQQGFASPLGFSMALTATALLMSGIGYKLLVQGKAVEKSVDHSSKQIEING